MTTVSWNWIEAKRLKVGDVIRHANTVMTVTKVEGIGRFREVHTLNHGVRKLIAEHLIDIQHRA